MKATALRRTSYLLIGLALLGLLVAFSWAHQTAQPAEAATTQPNLSAGIDTNGGGDDCDTRFDTGTGSTCTVSVGSMFTVKGYVVNITGITPAGAYGGIQFQFNHSAGLTLNQRPGTGELGPPYWPDCSSPSESKPSGGYQALCHDLVGGKTSAFTGNVVQVDYTCTTAGMQTVTMDDANTFLIDSGHVPDNFDKEGNEVLNINCVAAAAVGGIAELSDVSRATPLAAQDASSSVSIALMMGLAALVAAGLGGGALVVVRRRRS
jgi:hypothetical protein